MPIATRGGVPENPVGFAGREPASHARTPVAQEPVRILVVDDRTDNLLAVESVLRSPEYELVLVTSGREALRFLLHDDCALILLDVQMPDLDGFETARLVRGNPRTRSIPIVFMTAISREDRFIAKGYEAGAIDYLLKPVDPDVLRSKVAAFAELHRARQEIVRQAALLREKEREERQRAVEQLELRNLRRQHAANERYRRLMDGITHAVVWTLDPDTLACTFVSPSAERILGYSTHAWTADGTFWRERIPEPERDALVATVHALPVGASATFEHGFVRADGRTARFQTELRAFPPEEDGRPEIRGFSVDVTDARASRDALAFLARASVELAGSLELDDIVQRAADAAVPFLAEASAFVVTGRDGRVLDAIAPAGDDRAHALAAATSTRPAASDPSAASTLEEDVRPEPGGPAASAVTVPLGARGRAFGVARFFRAAERGFSSEEVRLVEEYAGRAAQAIENAQLYAEARAAVRLREEFISIASHELRTPLTPLALQTHALQRVVSTELPPGPLRTALLDRVATCSRQVERMTRFVANLLDMTRLRAHRLELQLEACDLRDLVVDVTARFQEELARLGRRIEVDAPEALVGAWDRTKLDQVVTNLVSNAVRYGGEGPIAVTARAAGAGVVVTVHDHGDGIAPEDAERIFERFERGATANVHGGLGLGLYIVRRIVEAHGGRISVASALGAGATFTVELPIRGADAAQAAAGRG